MISLPVLLISFLFTVLAELAAAAAIGISVRRYWREILLINAATNIPANIGIRLLFSLTDGSMGSWFLLTAVHEAGIFLLETGFIALFIRERPVPAWAASLALNLTSFLLGMAGWILL